MLKLIGTGLAFLDTRAPAEFQHSGRACRSGRSRPLCAVTASVNLNDLSGLRAEDNEKRPRTYGLCLQARLR